MTTHSFVAAFLVALGSFSSKPSTLLSASRVFATKSKARRSRAFFALSSHQLHFFTSILSLYCLFVHGGRLMLYKTPVSTIRLQSAHSLRDCRVFLLHYESLRRCRGQGVDQTQDWIFPALLLPSPLFKFFSLPFRNLAVVLATFIYLCFL
jgi:hypothetical protein